MLKGPFLSKDFIGATSSYNEAKIVMLGMPFDGTVSNRAGSRFAPREMRMESIGIETYSKTFDKNMEDTLFYDAGDLDLPFGNAKRALDMIKENVFEIYKSGKKVLGLGGEHLVTLGEIGAISQFYDDLAIIQFDAHTDLRQSYLGETLTHSGVMYQIAKIVGYQNIMQIGIRSGEKEEFELMKKHDTLALSPLELMKFKDKKVFLTIDIDVLDPSIVCGTGTAEAGGFTYKELINWLCNVAKLDIIGADIVELAPDYDASKTSTATACTLAREVLMMM